MQTGVVFPFLPVADGVFSDVQELRQCVPLPATEAIEADRDRLVTCSLRGGQVPSRSGRDGVAHRRCHPQGPGQFLMDEGRVRRLRYPGWLTLTIGGTVNSKRVACGHPADRSGADSGDNTWHSRCWCMGTPSRGVSSRAVAHTPSAGSPASVPARWTPGAHAASQAPGAAPLSRESNVRYRKSCRVVSCSSAARNPPPSPPAH